MPFEGVTGFGNQDGKTTTFASARDIGNVAAGYVAGKSGLSWGGARNGFDLLESKKNWTWATEGQPTQAAQRIGFRVGKTVWNRFVNQSFLYAQKNMITP